MLYFVTSNEEKIYRARQNLLPLGISFETKSLDFAEIQSENTDEITIKKAVDAFTVIQKPLFVNDESWFIPALHGFPGAYMKYMNKWLTQEDFLRLLEPYEDRTIILRETMCFTDGKETKVFSQDNTGIFLKKPQGKTKKPSLALTSFSHTGKSLGECLDEGLKPIDNITIWENFAQWYSSRTP